MLLQRKPPNPGDHLPAANHDQTRDHNSPICAPAPMAARNNPPAGARDKGQVKKELKKCGDRLDVLEQKGDRLEYLAEQQDSYRRLRIERCDLLEDLWSGFEQKQIPGNELRERTAAAIEEAVRTQLTRNTDEEAAQRKAHELSSGKRAIPTHTARQALAERFQIKNLVEWIWKDRSGAFNVVLVAGEPSRLVHDLVRKECNWPLFVLSKVENAPAKSVQIYPDRGPLQRKGKGKGKAKGKGKGKGGKGKGKQAQEDD